MYLVCDIIFQVFSTYQNSKSLDQKDEIISIYEEKEKAIISSHIWVKVSLKFHILEYNKIK